MNTASTSALSCKRCATSLGTGARFCPACGTDNAPATLPPDATAVISTRTPETVAADHVFALLHEATLGDYDLYGELGRGGMAAVYLALDLQLNRKVAIKTMLPELIAQDGMIARFRREAQTAAGLSHPHIIQIYSVKTTPNLVYFVMKYIEGRSLESVIVENRQLDVELTRVILKQVGGALAFAHRKNVVHRDVKPANVMIDEDGWAIVTDFGIAKVHDAQHLTVTGTAIGTPHYMAPELFHDAPVTGASDQYALGIMAFEMLTGQKPFDATSYAAIITKHLVEPPPDLHVLRPDVPAPMVDAINRMLAKEPAERFPDLDAAVAALGQSKASDGDVVRTVMISIAKQGASKQPRMSVPLSPVPAGRSPAPTVQENAPAKTGSRTKLWMSGVGAVVAAVGIGAAVVLMRPSASPASTGQSQATPPQSNTLPAAASGQADAGNKVNSSAPPPTNANPPAVARADSSPTAPKEPKKKPAATGTQTPSLAAAATAVVPAAPVGTGGSAAVLISSFTPGAALYVGNTMKAAVKGYTTVSVPAGPIHLSLRAPTCKQWDSTLTARASDTITVGRKSLECTP